MLDVQQPTRVVRCSDYAEQLNHGRGKLGKVPDVPKRRDYWSEFVQCYVANVDRKLDGDRRT